MSNNKVVSLKAGTTPEGQPVERVVQLLENALKRAKSGELRSIAIAGVCGNHDATTAYEHEDHIFALLGALNYLQARIQVALVDAD